MSDTLTFAQSFGGSRDVCCAAGVGDMAAMGRFDVEFDLYGCADWEHDEIIYRVSPVAEQIYTFLQQCSLQNLCATRVVNYHCSTPVPSGMQEKISRQAKLELAHILHRTYPRCYFELLGPFCQTMAEDYSLMLLEQMIEAIDGHFNKAELQLLEGTMQLVYGAKLLKKNSLQQIEKWLQKTRQQMEDDPLIQTEVSRTFYGFCYQEGRAPMKTVVNAQPVLVWEQQMKAQRSGFLTGPILQETRWFENAADITREHEHFRQEVQRLEGMRYFQLLHTIKQLPGAVDTLAYQRALHKIEALTEGQAVEDFRGYGYQWNCLKNK